MYVYIYIYVYVYTQQLVAFEQNLTYAVDGGLDLFC